MNDEARDDIETYLRAVRKAVLSQVRAGELLQPDREAWATRTRNLARLIEYQPNASQQGPVREAAIALSASAYWASRP